MLLQTFEGGCIIAECSNSTSLLATIDFDHEALDLCIFQCIFTNFTCSV